MISRRSFILRAGAGAVGMWWTSRLTAQQRPVARGGATRGETSGDSTAGMDSSNLFAMDQLASRPVRLPGKPGARPSMNAAQRDELEHHIRCQCGCTLDVYTCRTTDFSCQVSPAMHADVMALVDGGYTAQEILDAFVHVYGERVLMAPSKNGFNLVGYIAPFAALAGGAVLVLALIREWGGGRGRGTGGHVVGSLPVVPTAAEATPEELARLEAAVRDDR